ncbi:hypothetical protein EXIGLDRAFT_719185 [Exidia glandulosa HHB12029]|uniref:Uncharacterized protein n=1 Tax=Exidia glandulosa HHB12029 TaxID=1314781 RepID=A0A165H854_EXIGL|nr:hypothetical protein EXIGLDRAFT_719185 [Exidia glandulosa HHB12029]
MLASEIRPFSDRQTRRTRASGRDPLHGARRHVPNGRGTPSRLHEHKHVEEHVVSSSAGNERVTGRRQQRPSNSKG